MQVLVADDDAMSRELVGGLLTRWGYEPVFAENGTEALNILEGPDPPLLAIVDWMMPEMDGVDLCRTVRRNRQYPYTYIIVNTAKTQKQDLLSCLEAGADDYVCKPLNATELRARLYVAGRILNLQQKLLTAYNEAQYEATHDSVTGLWNRTSILKFLDHYLLRCAKNMSTLSLILAEITGLRDVNNDHGRAAGDKVLREAADRLRGAVKAYDCVGRYVGGEFLVVMPNCAQPKAELLLAEMRGVIGGAEFKVPNGDVVRLKLRTAVQILKNTAVENSKNLMERLEKDLAKGDYAPKSKDAAAIQPSETIMADPERAVLILSYDPLERGLLVKKVRDLGYSACDASSANAAIELLRGPKQIGLFMLDMRNPEPEELDFIAGLRMDQKFAELDIVVVTAWPVQKTVNRALSLNVSSFLTKPVDPAKLGQILSHLMGIPGEPVTPPVRQQSNRTEMRM